MTDKTKLQHFFAIIKPTRPDFLINPQKEDEKIMSDHFLYLQALLQKGQLFLAGPTLIKTDPFGLLIFETKTLEDARRLLEKDPSIKTGTQQIHDLRPMRVSLYKYQEN